ncbi:tripartite motif-containing protein 2-like [Ptychodera flava]|uniref:tripartite motif-containing protein 2-like n=1 Tax=Ptychodera flava TaxID=63121 RepID=UPI003969E76B
MAAEETKLLPEIDKSFLLCGICSERYKNAKILSCLHSFCEPCLGKLAETTGAIACPVCRRVHELTDNGVAAIQANVFLNDLIELFSKQENGDKSKKCDTCEQGEVTKHCIECTFDICDICARAHSKFPQFKSHRLVSLEEYNAAMSIDPSSVQPPIYCCTHPEYQVEFYCDTCNMAICLKCTALDHPLTKHQYRCVKDAAKEFTKNLYVVIDKVKVKETEANNSKLKVQQIFESLEKCFQREEESLRKHIRQTIDEITRLIQENGNKLLTELKGEYEKRKVNLTAQLKELDIAENDLTSTREYVEKLVHYGNASQLMSAKRRVDHQTDELLKVQTQVEQEEDDYMEFQLCNDFCRNKSLGTIKFLQTVYKLENLTQALRVGDSIKATVRNKGDFLPGKGVSQRVKVEAEMKTPDGNTQIVEVKDNENGTMTLKTRVEAEGEHELSVTVCKKPVEGSPVNIKVIAKKGLVCKFGEKGSGIDDGNKQVIVCDENGELIRCFGKGKIQYPIGIAINPVNGRVYIVDYSAHCIHIYDQDGNHIKSFGSNGSQKGQFRYPYFVCIDNTGNVYVSDCHNHRIQVFNSDGQFLYTFGRYGSGDGQMHYPQGVALNKHGYVYVADYRNSRILKFESVCKFVCRVDDHNACERLCNPTGLCVTDDGKVIVCDSGNNCIKVFTQ